MADEPSEQNKETEEPEAVAAEPEEAGPEEADSEQAEPEGAEEPAAEVEPAAEAEASVAEAEPEAPAADAETEPAAAEPQETEAQPAAEPPAEEPAAEAAQPAAPARKKKKRLPRSLRPARTRSRREKPKEPRPIVRLPKPEHSRGRRQERQGTVVSAATDKTIVVRVDTAKVHPRYKKVIRRSTKLHAHDETNQAKVGDIVLIVETRPLSKLKRWRLQQVVEAAK